MQSVQGEVPWEGRSRRELVRLSWPIAISMLSYAVMTLADTLFVGRLGTQALAGVGLGAMASFTPSRGGRPQLGRLVRGTTDADRREGAAEEPPASEPSHVARSGNTKHRSSIVPSA